MSSSAARSEYQGSQYGIDSGYDGSSQYGGGPRSDESSRDNAYDDDSQLDRDTEYSLTDSTSTVSGSDLTDSTSTISGDSLTDSTSTLSGSIFTDSTSTLSGSDLTDSTSTVLSSLTGHWRPQEHWGRLRASGRSSTVLSSTTGHSLSRGRWGPPGASDRSSTVPSSSTGHARPRDHRGAPRANDRSSTVSWSSTGQSRSRERQRSSQASDGSSTVSYYTVRSSEPRERRRPQSRAWSPPSTRNDDQVVVRRPGPWISEGYGAQYDQLNDSARRLPPEDPCTFGELVANCPDEQRFPGVYISVPGQSEGAFVRPEHAWPHLYHQVRTPPLALGPPPRRPASDEDESPSDDPEEGTCTEVRVGRRHSGRLVFVRRPAERSTQADSHGRRR